MEKPALEEEFDDIEAGINISREETKIEAPETEEDNLLKKQKSVEYTLEYQKKDNRLKSDCMSYIMFVIGIFFFALSVGEIKLI